MIKGVLVAFGIMVVLAPVPVVHIVGIPFGPFIGGYFGISSVDGSSLPYAPRALVFGSLLGVLVFILGALIAGVLTVLVDLNPLLLWGGVAVFTFYAASMAALGAMYSLLKSSE